MHSSNSESSGIVHQFGDRAVELTPLLLARVINEVIARLLKEKAGPMQEPLDQILLNQYTYLKYKDLR